MDKGVLYFAFNNGSIDYWYLASLSALTVKSNLLVPTCLVTKQSMHEYGVNKYGTSYSNKCFDHVKFVPEDTEFIDNKKVHNDGRWANRNLPYLNSMQTSCYQYTPFDETLLLDADYLVMSDNLNNCWGSQLDFMVNYYINYVGDNKGYQKTPLNFRSMNVLWSTCVYFKKSAYMDVFFDLVLYIKAHWQYYYSLYGMQSRMYRNDYVFSMAHHIMNGFVDASDMDSMPVKGIHVLSDINDIYDMPKKNSLTLLTEIPCETGNYVVSNYSDMDIHVQNKWAIQRIDERIREFYE